jgi:outer membrane protein assembly factor BamB
MKTNDYFHMNAVRILHDGNYLASARHTQTIMKIDKSSGEILWHMGKGSLNDFKFLNDPYNGFSHQHAPEELANSNILVWDNGIDSIENGSRVCEYEIDEKNLIATLIWSKEFNDLQANVAGNCFQINENNYIAAFGSQGYIEEFNKDGTKQLSIDPGGLIYQVMKSEIT